MNKQTALRIIRAEENALLIWNAEQARTAFFSGKELSLLEMWARGGNNPFIERVMELGIVGNGDKHAVVEAIALSRSRVAPPFSFCAPESLHIELTEACPLNCSQCYKGQARHQELDVALLSSVIQDAAQMQVFQIALGGGEPLLYSGLHQLIEEISTCAMVATITTSGYSLDRQLLDSLVSCGLRHVQVSLNGSSKEIDSRSRGGYEHALFALALLKDSQLSFGINWVARRDNLDDFPKLLQLAESFRVGNVNILRYKHSSGEAYEENYLLPKDELRLAKMIRSARSARKLRIRLDSAYASLLCYLNNQTSYMSGCGAGRRFLALDSQGYYRPCSHVNIREKANSLFETWYQSGHLNRFRTIGENVNAPCAGCDFLHGCYGCRALVLGQCACFFEGHAGCPFRTP
ncbi:MAG: radical SAM protein [Coriobacteriia bacterium]|nr:radical SAM protein [Coriobacteriia bacterium]